jgi:hypothetical protein
MRFFVIVTVIWKVVLYVRNMHNVEEKHFSTRAKPGRVASILQKITTA